MATNTVKSWSYSRFRDYDRCPSYFKYKHLDKLPEPDSPAMARGSAIGKLAEQYVLGQIKQLPMELSLMDGRFEAVRARKGRNVWVEQSWAFTRDWEPCSSTDWNRAWLRVKMDICGIDEQGLLVPVDIKTGKYREFDIQSYLEQLQIYAMGGMVQHPQTVGASPRLWFLDAGVEYPQVNDTDLYYPRKEVPTLQKDWTRRVIPLFTDTKFKPKPNNKCKWCPYSKAVDGPCIF